MAKRILFFILTLFTAFTIRAQSFPSVQSVQQFVNDSIKVRPEKISANTVNKAYTGIISFLGDIVDDTSSVIAPKHGQVRFQKKDSTAYVYDTAGFFRWRRYTAKVSSFDSSSLSNRVNQKQAYSDTSTYDATRYWVQSQNYLKSTSSHWTPTTGYTYDTVGNVVIGTSANDGHKLRVVGSVRLDVGSDTYGDMLYRDSTGTLTRIPKPATAGTKPVLTFRANYPQWVEDSSGGSSIDTAGKWITSVYRKNSSDSVFYVKGGVAYFAYRDSTGGGASPTTYIQNQTAAAQTGGFRVSGNGIIQGQLKVGNNFGSNSYAGEFNQDMAASNVIDVNNDPTSSSGFYVTNSALTTNGRFVYYGTSFSSSGIEQAGRIVVMSVNANGLNVGTYTSQSLDLFTNNTKRASFSPSGDLTLSAGLATPISAKTTAYSATALDYTITGNTASGAFSVTLPTAADAAGRIYVVKKTDSSANALTVATTSSQTIDGSTTYSLGTQNKYVTVQSDGSNWIIIGNN